MYCTHKRLFMTKISDDELTEVNELRIKMSTTVNEVGNATLQIKLLQEDIKFLQNTVEEQTVIFQQQLEEEKQLVKRLSDKYGVGSINFETGEFTSGT